MQDGVIAKMKQFAARFPINSVGLVKNERGFRLNVYIELFCYEMGDIHPRHFY